jgi:phosphoribosyl-ATP pyrophosphohydrolase/phosphoribosyl-AMP cyclohydrolase
MPELRFDSDGLIACIVQDAETGAVLTLAFMNEESLARTRESGETWFFSRSRNELWHKGATSGNTQKVRELRVDCDGDAILALVEPTGPACHTGETTCFFGSLDAEKPLQTQTFEAPAALQATLDARKAELPEDSYTTKLLGDPPLIAEKVMEEAEEVTRAAREESDERVANEAADVLYHLAVLMTQRDLSLQDAFEILNDRAG